MAEKQLKESAIRSVPITGVGEKADGFELVPAFLERFGYVNPSEASLVTASALTDETSTALQRYQQFHGLPVTGEFDQMTRDMMAKPRCALPDVGSGIDFSTRCAWDRTSLTYAFDTGTADVAGDAEWQAIRNAFATWSASAQLSFRQVAVNQNPDILVGWRPANDPDHSMLGGVLAHADFPPGCGVVTNSLPKPLHFDDQEHAWTIGAVAGQFDIETVALHEIGHLLGLQHSSVAGSVMFPTVSDNATLRQLTADDIEGILSLYPLRGPVFARHSGLCLDVTGISTADGAGIQQWDYWGGGNQIFKFVWAGAGQYRMIVEHSGKCADITGISLADGARLQQWTSHGGPNQRFRPEHIGNGYYRLVAAHSGKCLDVSGVATTNGAPVVQWTAHGGANQQWRLGPAPICAKHTGKALDVAAISTLNGASIQQWDYWGGANQRFRFDPVGGGFYRITIMHTGKCLDVEGLSTADGARVHQWEYWGGQNQQFKIEAVGGGYYRIVARHSGKCLDVRAISTVNGAQVQQWPWNGGDNQRWRL